MDSNLLVELYVTKRSCQDLFKELNNIWMKKKMNWITMIFST